MRLLPLFPLALALTTIPASAQDSVTSSYGDWSVTCDARTDPPACEASTAVSGGAGATVRLALAPANGEEGSVMALLLPLGVDLREGPQVDFDGEITALTWVRCDVGACIADTRIPSETVARLSTAEAVQVGFTTVEGQPVIARLSVNGMADALAALAEGP